MNFILEMINEPYLIQRGKFEKTPDDQIVGFDSLVHLDYMGSSEFEFGAVQESLTRIAKSWDQYEIFPLDVKDNDDNQMFVLCKKLAFKEIKLAIEELISKEYCFFRLKETAKLWNYLNPKSMYDLDCNFWWDITHSNKFNDYMICFGDNIRRLTIAITKVCEKRNIMFSSPTLQPCFPILSKVSTLQFNFDRINFVILNSTEKIIIKKRSILKVEEFETELIVTVKVKTKEKRIVIKAGKSSVRKTLILCFKEHVEFNKNLQKSIERSK